jgi:chromosome segregation ATPase
MPNLKGHEDSIKDSRFKAAWQSGPTRTIRVPIALADLTLEYARQLDQGVEPRDTEVNTDSQTDNPVSTLAIEPRDTGNGQAELEEAKISYKALLDSSTHITNKLREEVRELRSQLATERADREEIEAELEDLKQNSATASKDLPEAADLLNRFKNKYPKSKLTYGEMRALLGMIEES